MGSSNDQSAKLKAYHAAMTPEQRKAWRENISIATKAGMHRWHARRTEEERERSRALQTDANVCNMWTQRNPKYKFPKGHAPMGNHDTAALARVERASVKRILKDIAGTQPDLIEAAIIRGLLAEPPRSFPYIALAAAYLDGKPVDASNDIHVNPMPDLSELTREELYDRAMALATRIRDQAKARVTAALPVIDAEAVPQEDK